MLRLISAVKFVVAIMLVAGLAACAGTVNLEDPGSGLLEEKLEAKGGRSSKQAKFDSYVRENSPERLDNSLGFVNSGNDRQIGVLQQEMLEASEGGEKTISVNLVDAPVNAVAKRVMGDILKLSYTIDKDVQGTLTLQTGERVSKGELVALFEESLSGIGLAVVANDSSFRIVARTNARNVASALEAGVGDSETPGQKPYIVGLKFVSAAEIKEVIDPIVPPNMVVRADTKRNAILLFGTSREVAAIRETISVFDVDWMRGMSFALVQVRSSDPQSIVDDLDQIYDTKNGPLRGIIRFVPNKRLRSVLVISSKSKYLRESRAWIRKLDALADQNEESLHVYNVQNRTAAELAKVLQSVLQADAGAIAAAKAQRGEVAPRFKTQETTTEIPVGPETPQRGLGTAEEVEAESGLPGIDTPPVVVSTPNGSRIRIVSDDANNSLLVFATDTEYRRILQVLQEIDSQANQVLLEAVIAEVTLDDELKFGVRWLLGGEKSHGTFSDLATGAVASSFPGFSYFLKANDIGFTLNALSSVTDVRVLSSPSLVVLDNKTAVLQVGDQVPIVTQQARGVVAADAPLVNSVELKDTGVILSVTPRINDSGRVILEVEQEVSSVVRTTTSGIDSPTIRQRKIKTAVVVNDGDALALGGLIQERENTGKTKVPVLGDVPLLGNAFRTKTNAIARTELIIFIRPRVMRDMDEARRITREFSYELGVQAPRVRRGDATPKDELVRILE